MSGQAYEREKEPTPQRTRTPQLRDDDVLVDPFRASVTPHFPTEGSNGALTLTIAIPPTVGVEEHVDSGRAIPQGTEVTVRIWMKSLEDRSDDMSYEDCTLVAGPFVVGNGPWEVQCESSAANYNENAPFYGIASQFFNTTAHLLEDFNSEAFNNNPGGVGTSQGGPLSVNISGGYSPAGPAVLDVTFATDTTAAPDGVTYYAKLWAVHLVAGMTTVTYDPQITTAVSEQGDLPGSIANAGADMDPSFPNVGFVAEIHQVLGRADTVIYTSCQIFNAPATEAWTFIAEGTPNPQ